MTKVIYRDIIWPRMKKKIIFILPILILAASFLLVPKSTSASLGYDLQLTAVSICYKEVTQNSQGLWQGTFSIGVKVRNNGAVASPPTRVALDLGEECLWPYGYPTVTTCDIPSVPGNSTVSKTCEQTLTTCGYGRMAWIDLSDDNNSNNEYYGISWLNPCPVSPTPPLPSVCPLGPAQEQGTLKETINNEWRYYVSFVPTYSGWVNWVQVKAGNWGSAWRNITCKVTDGGGQLNVSLEKSSEMFRSDSGAQWRNLDFRANPFFLKAGNTYRLYCKGPDSWGSLYWIYSQLNNPNSKTYRIYMCP